MMSYIKKNEYSPKHLLGSDKNNFEFKKNDIYNKNICIVSPFLKTKDSLDFF